MNGIVRLTGESPQSVPVVGRIVSVWFWGVPQHISRILLRDRILEG